MTSEFDDYIRDILDFEHTNKLGTQSYAERLGNPDELSSCIGLICTAFQTLEEELSEAISKMIGESPDVGRVLTSEMSFKNRVHAFASLVRLLSPTHNFNSVVGHEGEYLDRLVKALFKAEELRNRVIHSMIVEPVSRGSETRRIVRIKRTAKASTGLRDTQEEITIEHLLNIYDWTVSLGMEVDMFFIDFGRKN